MYFLTVLEVRSSRSGAVSVGVWCGLFPWCVDGASSLCPHGLSSLCARTERAPVSLYLMRMSALQGVTLIFTGGHISLAVAFKGLK